MNAGQKALIEEFPIPVSFPTFQGRHLMLHWSSYNERSHVALGRDMKQIFLEYGAAVARERDAKAEALYQIDIVAPPEEMQLASAKTMRKLDISGFSHFVSRRLLTLLETDGALPPGFKRCEEPADEYGNHSSDCEKCHDGFLYGLPKLYREKKDLYREMQFNGYTQLKRASRAPLADPDRNLFAVQTGSTSKVLLQVFKKDYGCTWGDTLFFCHATPMSVPNEIIRVRADMDYERKVQKERIEKESEARRLEAQKAAIERARRFFA